MPDEIKNVLICGLGGLGSICAVSILNSGCGCLKVLVDEERFKRYSSGPLYFNNKPYCFSYTLPSENNFKADLVIIATKSTGLNEVLANMKNFIKEDTVFISLLNGINSENEIAAKYSDKNVLTSFYLGHSCIRDGRNVYQDGVYDIVTGITKPYQRPALEKAADYFRKSGIHFKIPDDIMCDYWKKFMINVGINQLSAVTGLTLKGIKQDEKLVLRLKSLMKEAETVAEYEGVKNHKSAFESAVNFLFVEIDDAEASMLQDIKAKRQTEVDIFSGEIIKLARKHNIEVPENTKIYNQIISIQGQYKKVKC